MENLNFETKICFLFEKKIARCAKVVKIGVTMLAASIDERFFSRTHSTGQILAILALGFCRFTLIF